MSETIGQVFQAMRDDTQNRDVIYWFGRLEEAMKTAPDRVHSEAYHMWHQNGSSEPSDHGVYVLAAFRHELGMGP